MLTPKSILRLATPPYLFQPLQIIKRVRLEYLWRSKREVFVDLPWGLPIKINLRETIGYNIASQGLYEIGVTETLWRLTDPGDLAIDAGANIGYTSSILGTRVGPRGRVICFEPHPDIFDSLKENVEIWRKEPRCGSFVLHRAALGAENGHASLHTNDLFLTNRGTAWVSNNAEATPGLRIIDVPVQSLDSLVGEDETIGVLKVDVQGSELGVLQGMTRLLRRRAVRDIVFEEEHTFPAPTHEYLKSHRYSVFALQERLTGVDCVPDAPAKSAIPNYLATADPERAKARLGRVLWRSFGPGRFFGFGPRR